MSERLQHKMYSYEVAPPEAVWEKIASALDDSEMSHEFPSKLYGIEINPPAGAWENIRTTLDNESSPTTGAKTNNIFIRYAVAASIIGLIAFSSIQIIRAKKANKEVGQQKTMLGGTDTVMPSINNNLTSNEKEIATINEKRDDAALEESKHMFAKLDMPAKSRIKVASSFYFTHPGSNDDETNNQFHYAEAIHAGLSQPDTKNYLASRYITLLTPDGSFIRMSKRLIDLACCVSGEEQDADCKDQLQKWREKIACSPINASPANFMDILGLINSLQNNED